MKVPHHGSLTSSTTEFIRALRPQVAVVSVGRANRFGHPVPEVLDRYREAGADIFRTDRDGAVTIDTDGYSLDVHTFNGPTQGLVSNHEDHEGHEDRGHVADVDQARCGESRSVREVIGCRIGGAPTTWAGLSSRLFTTSGMPSNCAVEV